MNIQWFPGHMVKARRLITENLRRVDAVCEIIDARIPKSSRNPDLDDLAGGKPRLIVFNRTDLADTGMNAKWAAHYRQHYSALIETDCKSGRGVAGLQQAALRLLDDKIKANTAKGQSGKRLRLMVVGIPNAGKSSLINRAAKRKAAQTADRPGVTRGEQWIRLGNGIELLDTPGVLWPKFEDSTVAENLAFTGAIRDEIMDIETLGALLMLRLACLYPQCVMERYKVDASNVDCDVPGSGFELLIEAAKKRGFLLRGGEPDTERMGKILLDEFRGGKLGRITLEWL